MPTPFELDPRLAADCFVLGDWPLSRVLLMNDAQYPWAILVPRRAGVREIHDLDPADRHCLLDESAQLGRVLMQVFAGHKLNVAALGNIVPQLHLHHIVRQPTDPAWPAPVWGKLARQPYAQAEAQHRIARLRAALQLDG
jgi:diadenosine tetraphosphate (Ap4A) HIT family hydrolase